MGFVGFMASVVLYKSYKMRRGQPIQQSEAKGNHSGFSLSKMVAQASVPVPARAGTPVSPDRARSEEGFTLVEVMIAAAISVLAIGMVMMATIKGLEMGKWQSAYQTACSYGEQGLEYALYVPYDDFSLTNATLTSPNWVSNGFLYTTATGTNMINTTKDSNPYVLTNITYLATQTTLPLDDLGSYLLERYVVITDRTVLEPAATNLNYKLVTVSNTWVFLGRTMPPIVYVTIRDAP